MSIPAYSLTFSSVTCCENFPIDLPSCEIITSWVPISSKSRIVSKSPLLEVFTTILSASNFGEIVVTATGIFCELLPILPSYWLPDKVTVGFCSIASNFM